MQGQHTCEHGAEAALMRGPLLMGACRVPQPRNMPALAKNFAPAVRQSKRTTWGVKGTKLIDMYHPPTARRQTNHWQGDECAKEGGGG